MRPSTRIWSGTALAASVLFLAVPSAEAHGGGALHGMHNARRSTEPASRTTPSTPGPSHGMEAAAKPAGAAQSGQSETSSTGQTSAATPPTQPDFAACDAAGTVAANCEAMTESLSTVTGGDPSPRWTAPAPVAVPPTPAATPIPPPQTAVQPFTEQSGGPARPVIQGGGPTLADCMALWEPDLHMTKPLWRTTCIRTMNGIDMPEVALGDSSGAATPRTHHGRSRTHEARN